MYLYSTRFQDGLPALVQEKVLPSSIDRITAPNHAYAICEDCLQLSQRTEEFVYAIALNTKGKVLGVFEISHGTVSMTCIQPREIMIRLLLVGAVNFLVVHNHPSQDTRPSSEDLAVTKRLYTAGELIGIGLLDHIIVSDHSFCSLSETEGFPF